MKETFFFTENCNSTERKLFRIKILLLRIEREAAKWQKKLIIIIIFSEKLYGKNNNAK